MKPELQVDWWDSLRENMRGRFGADLFDRWFAGLSLLAIEDGEIRIGVPNGFVLDWIRAKYLDRLTEACRDVAGRDVTVRLRVDPELFQRLREDQRKVFPPAAPGGGARPPAVPHASRERASGPPSRGDSRAGAREGCDLTLENLVTGASNRLAVSAALEILSRPGRVYNPFFVFGPSGVGKTHLLRAIGHALGRGGRCRLCGRDGVKGDRPERLAREVRVPPDLKVMYLTGERFFNQFVASIQDGSLRAFHERFRSLDVLIVDDIQVLASKKKTQLEFLHTFNSLADAGKQVIVSSDVPPRDLVGLDPSLVGRFLSGLVTGLRKPDYKTRVGILLQNARRLKSRFDAKVIEQLAETFRGNARELIGALMQLDVHARLLDGPLEEDTARAILAERLRDQQRRITVNRIHHQAARHYELPPEALISGDRHRCVSRARQVAMYLTRRYTRKSLAEIGRYFGNRNHATVKSAVGKIAALVEDPGSPVAQDVRVIAEMLEGCRTST